MKEKPILFSAPMVRAILDGSKTMTRRVVKVKDVAEYMGCCDETWHFKPEHNGKHLFDTKDGEIFSLSPYGQPGDQLWVRETWAYRLDYSRIYYRADQNLAAEFNRLDDKWKPSIFMPRKHSRIDLLIKLVRVERLNDIDELDATHEGIKSFTKDGVGFKFGLEGWNWSCQNGHPFMCSNPVLAFSELWESINGKGSWDANPYVWVIEFERIKP